ncbi:MAG: WbqC family protein [bacterium]
MSRIVAIHQPNFLPWLGYFHKMNEADEFVLLDNVQFPKGSYANRVKIKNRQQQAVWLTVPVRLSDGSRQKYNEIEIAYDHQWQVDHANLLRDAYGQAPYFDQYFGDLMDLMTDRQYEHLAALSTALIRHLKRLLGIITPLRLAAELPGPFGTGNERNLNICRHLGADVYLSGQGARSYNDEALFTSHGIELRYQHFDHPQYAQLHGEFIAKLSVIDLLFNCGPESRTILERA